MARKIEPHELIANSFDRLVRGVNNLLVNNRNFKAQKDPVTLRYKEAHYFAEHPRTADYVAHVLKLHAELIVEEIEQLKVLAVDYSDIKQFSLEELEAEITRRKAEAPVPQAA